MYFLFAIGYLFFCFLVAMLLKDRKGGFYLMLILSIILTPIVIGFAGLIFQDKFLQDK